MVFIALPLFFSVKISKLLCEGLETPIAIDSRSPRFSWILEAEKNERNKRQSAYRVIVSDSVEEIVKDNGQIWDSGIVQSDQSHFVRFDGAELRSRKKYYWKVKIWDELGKELPWSEPSWFRMAVFPEDWKAKWIGEDLKVSYEERFPIATELKDCPEWIKTAARREHPDADKGYENKYAYAVYLQREIPIPLKLNSAILRIAGLGYNILYINGKKYDGYVLDPPVSDYMKSIYYSTIEIKDYVENNLLTLMVVLGGGWYWMGTPELFGFENAPWTAPPRLLCELELEYEDGTTQIINSDEQWVMSTNGPIRFNCVRSGEVYDAQKEFGLKWFTSSGRLPGDPDWHPVSILSAKYGILRARTQPPIRKRAMQFPIKSYQKEDKIIYWYPKNNAGWVRMTIRGKKGQKIKIEMNEKLTAEGLVDMTIHTSHTYGPFQTLEYICKGAEIEVYEPSFCYAGFQYVQISGADPDQIIELVAIQVCTDHAENGHFRCSDLRINAINEAAKLTFENGFHSYPEDCPQREKAGWTEDGLISSMGSVYNYKVYHSYKKWIQDFSDHQHESGQVPVIVPTPGWGKPHVVGDPEDLMDWNEKYVGKMADPWWGGACVMLPWHIYNHYADIDVLVQNYSMMKKYVDFLLQTTRIGPNEYSYIINWRTLLGDWLEVGSMGSANRTPKPLTCTQAFYRCAWVVWQIAELLGKIEDAEKYRILTENIKKAYLEEFFNQKDNTFAKDSQSAHAMSLVLGLCPQGTEKAVALNLVKNIKEKWNGHLSTGIVGTYFLFKALGENGFADIAYDVLTKSGFPGYMHNLTYFDSRTPLGSTTLWEDWAGVSSHAHPVQGCVVSFFYEFLAGVKRLPEEVGYKHFCIEPAFISGLEWVKCSYICEYGPISIYWKREMDGIRCELEIPPNSSAELHLSRNRYGTQFRLDALTENEKPISKETPGILNIIETDDAKQISLGSGKYLFKFMF